MSQPSPETDRLSVVNPRVSLSLTAIMLAIYFGFILLIAFDKPLAGSLVGGVPGLSVGILLGALVIVSAWVLTAIYVSWANRHDAGQETAAANGNLNR